MQVAKKAAGEFAPHQKAVDDLLPRLQKAQKGEAVEFSDAEKLQLQTAAKAAEKLLALSDIFPAAIGEQLKTMLLRANAAKSSNIAKANEEELPPLVIKIAVKDFKPTVLRIFNTAKQTVFGPIISNDWSKKIEVPIDDLKKQSIREFKAVVYKADNSPERIAMPFTVSYNTLSVEIFIEIADKAIPTPNPPTPNNLEAKVNLIALYTSCNATISGWESEIQNLLQGVVDKTITPVNLAFKSALTNVKNALAEHDTVLLNAQSEISSIFEFANIGALAWVSTKISLIKGISDAALLSLNVAKDTAALSIGKTLNDASKKFESTATTNFTMEGSKIAEEVSSELKAKYYTPYITEGSRLLAVCKMLQFFIGDRSHKLAGTLTIEQIVAENTIITNIEKQIKELKTGASSLASAPVVDSEKMALDIEKYIWSIALPYFKRSTPRLEITGYAYYHTMTKPVRLRLVIVGIWGEANILDVKIPQYTPEAEDWQTMCLINWAVKYKATRPVF